MPTWTERFKLSGSRPVKQGHLIKGEHAEQQAAKYLLSHGLKLVEKNYRAQGGEIDLIMQDAECLVFVEVRFRKQHGFGSASETVDFRKQNKLIKAAQQYLQQHQITDKVPCRFDVVGINQLPNESQGRSKHEIDWIKNAF
ncbi:YraN family protein [Aurantivibrio plasticivorans]